MKGPADNEIEINVFGRGYGESTLIHFGSQRWLLVDSLLNAAGNPAALIYLSSIGLNAASCLKFMVATHWHDDHVAGLAEAYGQCAESILAFPTALRSDEWRAFRQSVTRLGSERFGSGVRELEKLAALQSELGRPAVKLAKANTVLARVPADQMAHGQDVEIEFLSPSDRDVLNFFEVLANQTLPEPVSRAEPFDRNDVSIATWIKIGAHRILLGGDLEVTGAQDTGWEAVLRSTAPITGVAQFHKVAHHGSQNGYHPEIWAKHVGSDAIAVLAPYNRGHKLPRRADVERICALTQRALATGQADKRPSKRDPAVEKTLSEAGYEITSMREVGHVRVRFDPNAPTDTWQVETLNGAIPLKDFRAAS